jgi:hypothetical protein
MNDDPQFHVDGKALTSREFDTQLGAYVAVTDTQVPHGEPQGSITFGVIPAIKNERNVSKSRKIVINVATSAGSPVFYDLGDTTIFGAGELQRFATQLNSEQKVVVTGTAHSTAFLTITDTLKKLDPVHWKRDQVAAVSFDPLKSVSVDEDGNQWEVTKTVVAHDAALAVGAELEEVDTRHAIVSSAPSLKADAGTRTSWVQDEETCLWVKREVALVDPPGNPPASPAAGTEVVYQTIPNVTAKVRKITQTLTNYAGWTRVSSAQIDYRTPAIFGGFTAGDTEALFSNRELRTYLILRYANFREGTSQQVIVKVTETLHTSGVFGGAGPTRETIFDPLDSPVKYNGFLFNIDLPACIHNGETLTANTNSLDTFYGYGAETHTFAPSPTSYSTYAAAVGTEVFIKDELAPWRFCLFKRTRWQVVVPAILPAMTA